MTYRDRREARAEKLQEWATKREAAASAQLTSNPEMRHDWAFITQPGHIPARARMIAADNRAFESLTKARSMSNRAANISQQLDSSIYSDDPDAIEQLTERLEVLKAEWARVKAFNASCRKGTPDWSILTESEQAHHRRTLDIAGWQCKGGAFPGYHLSNLSGNIKRNRVRLAELEAKRDDHGPGCDGPLNCTCGEPAGLIGCDHPGCHARFFHVAAREFPNLCLEHSDDAKRSAHGWTPENSVD